MTKPATSPRATKLVREHYREILVLERDELVRLRSIYEAVRRDALARLAEAPAERFTAQHLRYSIIQIEAGLAAMSRRLNEQGVRAVRLALRRGVVHALEEIAQYEPKFAGVAGAIRLDALRRIVEPEGLLLDRYEASVARFSAELRGDVQRRLRVHLVRRSFMREVVQDFAGKLGSSAISGARYKAERIVRTEFHNALSAGNHAALESAAEVLPGLKRQWDAMLDARTSSICRSLDGQVVGMRELFRAEGRELVGPPAHPNCRSRAVPWREEWAELEPQPVERSKGSKLADGDGLARDLARLKSITAGLPAAQRAMLEAELADLSPIVELAR